MSRTLSLRPLCALGAISYGVYLYHWPIDVVLDRTRVGIAGWSLFAIQTAVTIAIAAASYRWIEQPVRHGALSSVQWRALMPAIAITIMVVVFAATSTTGTTSASTGFTVAAGAPTKAATRAFRVAPAGSERVMVAGNSVAFALGQGFEQLETEQHLSVFNAGILGCSFPPAVHVPPFVMANGSRLTARPCGPAWEPAVVSRFRPQVVFWIVTNPAGGGGTYLGHDIEPCSRAWDALYDRSLKKEVGVLGAAGATVVITTSAYTRYFGLHGDDRAVDCDNRERRIIAAETGAHLVDLFRYICPDGQCQWRKNGVVLRPDGLHYEGPGAKIVARWLLDQVRPELGSSDIWGARR